MLKLTNFLKNIKIDLDVWFFFLFLLTFTLSVRKVWFYFPIQGTFNEYTGLYVYISDIFLLLTMISWLTPVLYNFTNKLSMDRLWITSLFHKLSELSTLIKSNSLFYLPILFIIFAFLSIEWSDNKTVAVFRSIKLLEYYFLYLYIAIRLTPSMFHVEHEQNYSTSGTTSNVPRLSAEMEDETLLLTKRGEIVFLIIIIAASIHSIIGILQIGLQHSIGLTALKESIISPILPGVAKVAFNGQKFIRAYGLMPHPNILGGFLLFSSIITLLLLEMFHVEHYKSFFSSNSDPVNKEHYVPRGTYYGLLALQLSGFLISLSKSAIIGFILALVYIHSSNLLDLQKMFHKCSLEKLKRFKTSAARILCSTWNILMLRETFPISQPGQSMNDGTDYKFYKNDRTHVAVHITPIQMTRNQRSAIATKNVPRLPAGMEGGTFKHISDAHKEKTRIFTLIALILVTVAFLTWPLIISNISDSLQQRFLFQDVSRGTISSRPIAGVGIGQYILQMYTDYPNLDNWQFQPVHNTFLLIWSELGIVGLGLFIFWIYKLFHVEQSTLSFIRATHQSSKRKVKDEIGNSLIAQDAKDKNQEEFILCNNYNDSSIDTYLRYFKGILLGLIFIMLFDHYLWDIQQGSFLLWVTAGFIAGIHNLCYNPHINKAHEPKNS